MKAGGETVQKDFREKYRELKIESNRGKTGRDFLYGKTEFIEAEIS